MLKLNRFFMLMILLSLVSPIFLQSKSITAHLDTYAVVRTDKFTCTEDSYVDSSNPNSNYGSADLKVSYYSSLNSFQVSFLKFEVTNLPMDAEIFEVKFEISVKYMPADDHTTDVGIWETDSFSEYSITWDNMPSMELNDTNLVGIGSITENARWEFTLSDNGYENHEPHHIRGNGNYYFMLFTSTDNLWPITFDSRDDTWNPPKLAITYESTSEANNNTNDYLYDDDYTLKDLIGALLVIVIIIGGIAYYQSKKKDKKDESSETKQILYENDHKIEKNRDSASTTSKKYFCTNCGKSISKEDKFCSNCGKKI